MTEDIRIISVVGLSSFIIGLVLAVFMVPDTTLVEAIDAMPVPAVEARCDSWFITDAAYDYFWDEGDAVNTAGADYFTVDDLPNQYGQGETAIIPAKAAEIYNRGSFYITLWDSDRPGDPEALVRVGVAVPEAASCS